MKREELEQVLLKSFDYWKELFCSDIDLGDLNELSDFIWDSIRDDQEFYEESEHVFLITKTSLNVLITMGNYCFKNKFGNTIILKFVDDEDPPCVLESGVLLVYDKNPKSQQKITQYIQETNKNTSSECSRQIREAEKRLSKKSRNKIHKKR
jgi:hypothetical protein